MMTSDSIFQQNLRHVVLNQIEEESSISKRVIEAMKEVPRHYFVADELQLDSYDDKPLPIASGQTISQITTVAIQTNLLNVHKGDKVLEIGTGSGYQSAILSQLGCKVYSIERIEELFYIAKKNLSKLDSKPDITISFGDGFEGLPQFAPYDAIIVTCGASSIPDKLIKQLVVGGKMVVPVGVKTQEMLVIEKVDDNEYTTNSAGYFSFVPMIKGIVKR